MKIIATQSEVLKAMIDYGVVAFLKEPVRLKSGRHSRFYVSGRSEMTENTALGLMIGYSIKELADKIMRISNDALKKRCYIGIPTVGTGLAAATVMAHCMFGEEEKACYAILREQRKGYGKDQSWLNGKPDQVTKRYVLIDNVLTTGESYLNAARQLREDKFDVKELYNIVFVDRTFNDISETVCSGTGLTNIHSVFTLKNIVEEAVKNSWWPAEAQTVFEHEKTNWNRSGGGEGV
jgi:orotate phosphoribosyltransferase